MNLPPDASGLSPSKDLATYRRKPLLGVTFWAMLALMLLCVLAGVAVATLGPRGLGPRSPEKPTFSQVEPETLAGPDRGSLASAPRSAK